MPSIPGARQILLAAGLLAFAVMAADEASADPPPAGRTLTLVQAAALAKERAPQVHAAAAGVSVADAEVARSRAAVLPAFALQGGGVGFASVGRTYAGGVVTTDQTQLYGVGQATLGVQWLLSDFGKTSSAVDAARSGVQSAIERAREVEQAAISEAAVVYYTVLSDEDLVAGDSEVLRERERTLAITRRSVESGNRAAIDERRAELAVGTAKLEVARAQAEYESDRTVLASLLRLDPREPWRLERPHPLAVDAAAGTTIEARHEVVAARAKVEQARRASEAARRARLPTLSAAAFGTVLWAAQQSSASQQSPSSSEGPSVLGQVSLTATLPLSDPQIEANVRAAEANVSSATAELERVTLRARLDVDVAASRLANARSLLAQAEHLAAASRASLAAMEDRYAAGVETPLALVDLQREDALARIAVIRGQLAVDTGSVQLLAAQARAEVLLQAR
jgi:outer membrane protein TolC